MLTSARERAKIKEWEGKFLVAYDDGGGTWTIGWGHIAGVHPGQTCTDEQAEEFLTEDLAVAEKAVNSFITVPLTQGQFDVLVSFTMNLGRGALEGSTLRRLLNSGDYASVPVQLKRWDHDEVNGQLVQVRGLTRRRADEANDWIAASAPLNPIHQDGSRTINGGTVAGAGGAIVVAEQANEAINTASWHLGAGNSIGIIIGLLILAGAAWAIYARLDDAGKLPWHRKTAPAEPVVAPVAVKTGETA